MSRTFFFTLFTALILNGAALADQNFGRPLATAELAVLSGGAAPALDVQISQQALPDLSLNGNHIDGQAFNSTLGVVAISQNTGANSHMEQNISVQIGSLILSALGY